jgi:glycosyltransferase involved in cell wall biosynthesis
VDDTTLIAGEFGATVLSANLGMAASRNLGSSNSSGKYLFNIDSDFELEKGLLWECVSLCEHGQDAVSIREEFKGGGFWGECRRLEHRTYWRNPVIESPRFYRRSVSDDLEGYDPTLTAGEDYDFGIRLLKHHYRVAFAERFILHDEPSDLARIVMKKYRYGKTIHRYFRKHGTRGLREFSFVRRDWISRRKLLLARPQYAVGIVVVKYLQYLTALLGMLCPLKTDE